MEKRFETFTALVSGISRAIRKIKSEEMVEFHLKGPHVSCLYHLYKGGALTANRLCALCEEDKANMSRTIEHLEQQGYIAPRTGPRYRAAVRLTDAGMRVGEQIAKKIDRVLSLASEGVSEEHRVILYESLAKIHANLLCVCDAYDQKSN